MSHSNRTKVKSIITKTLNTHSRINNKVSVVTNTLIVILAEKVFRKIQSYVISS